MNDFKMLINGAWRDGSSTTPVINPATEDVVAEIPEAGPDQVEEALETAKSAQKAWAKRTGVERGNVLRKWADIIAERKESYAQLLSAEVGKPINEARGEVDFGLGWMRYWAEFDRRIDGEILAADKPGEQLWILPQPAGVAVGIIAWNFPFALAVRKIAPALISGCSIVLKPHEDTPLAPVELVKSAAEAGVPPGVINLVTGRGETVGQQLCESKIPGVISFTGSVPTGKHIAKTAAENVTMVSLEMGGKAPFIVMDDADVDTAVDVAVFSRFFNCGQICIANERTYVHRSVAGQFLEKFVSKVKAMKVGDPSNEETDLGPKVSGPELDKVERYVNEAVAAGAEAAVGGGRLTGGAYDKGFWFQPTVLTNVRQDMAIMHEEIFGPVVPVMTFDDFDEGLAMANDSRYGLAAYFFSNDMRRIMQAVRDLEFGELYINRGPGESYHGFHTGWKESGIGGDDGKYGLEHYLRRKTVYLKYE